MIAQISGTIIDQTDKEVVMDVRGIGYNVYTVAPSFSLGTSTTLYTHHVIKDDAHELYGFQTKEERDFFKVLIGVTGVGPKTALAMLTLYTLRDIVSLIKNGDAKSISLVSGIGKKTAEKVVIDLKDKVEHFEGSGHKISNDLVDALLSLGYKEFQIRPVIGVIDATLPIEKQITEALQKIQK